MNIKEEDRVPLYNYTCLGCHSDVRHVSRSGPPLMPKCKFCGSDLHRVEKPPSTKVVEVLDNGLMVKALERPAEAERLNDERREAHERRVLEGEDR